MIDLGDWANERYRVPAQQEDQPEEDEEKP